MTMTIDEVFEIVSIDVNHAWRVTAPKQPNDSCVISVPIPGSVLDLTRDGAVLAARVAEMPMVASVECVSNVQDALYVAMHPGARPGVSKTYAPGLIVRGVPYARAGRD